MDSNEQRVLIWRTLCGPCRYREVGSTAPLHLDTNSLENVNFANLGWISQLRCLQDLEVACDRSHGQVLQDVLLLTKLARLDCLASWC